jgi:hypothetical protein
VDTNFNSILWLLAKEQKLTKFLKALYNQICKKKWTTPYNFISQVEDEKVRKEEFARELEWLLLCEEVSWRQQSRLFG